MSDPEHPYPLDTTSSMPVQALCHASPVVQPAPVGEHWRYCPRCSAELVNEKCKLRCLKCGYFMSCSDFDR